MNIIETNLSFNSMKRRTKTNRIILHHSGVTVLQSVEIIHNYHKITEGYSGIGYHFYVRKDGSIYRGRPEQYVGAHAYGANSDSIGICFQGDFNVEQMGEAQKKSGKELISYLKAKYNISTVLGHRDTIATSCPGNLFPFNEIVSGEVKPVEPSTETKEDVVKSLQEALNSTYNCGLVVDGIIGNKTMSALKKVALKNYCSNVLANWVQNRLTGKGYDVGNCGCDGKYGADTEKAVKQFQADRHLVVDGIAGVNTILALCD